MTDVLHSCYARASTVADNGKQKPINKDEVQLKVTKDALICGALTLPYNEFEEAYLAETRAKEAYACSIRVTVRGVTYNFEMNQDEYWQGELPFDVQRLNFELPVKLIWISALVKRTVFLGLLAWLIWWLLG